MRQLPLGVRLADRALFASFLAGPNQDAVAHLEALARQPRAGLSWLCGPLGSGKTHLLQALCAAAGEGAVYLPLSQLAPLGAGALADWQHARWLCVDEVGLVSGHADWERALFGLYRDCEERGASLLMAAREAPPQLSFALPDLASRCAAGFRLTLQPLDEDQQRDALRLRAQQRGCELPEETARYLQRRLPRDMNSLFGVLDELDAAALAAQRRITVPFIREVLEQRAPRLTQRCRVRGRVQGVYYRHSAAQRAVALGISGYAHNHADGSVEVLASGAPHAVREFVGWLWVGPPAAQVAAVEPLAHEPEAALPRGFTTA